VTKQFDNNLDHKLNKIVWWKANHFRYYGVAVCSLIIAFGLWHVSEALVYAFLAIGLLMTHLGWMSFLDHDQNSKAF
jgi:hypothetical protein